MDSIKNVFSFTLHWNPAYSYSEVPKGYRYDSVPVHLEAMLHKVIPLEKRIPHAKNVYVDNIKVTNAQTVFSAAGLEQSHLTHFVFSNSTISADVIGLLEFKKIGNSII